MLPDPNWLNALKLPTKVTMGLFIAAILLLAFDSYALLDLAQFGLLAKPFVITLAIVAGALSATGVGGFFLEEWLSSRKRTLLAARHQLRAEEKQKNQKAYETDVLQRIEHLSQHELRYLADCLRSGSQSFYTYVHSSPVTTLMGKGLVYTPGGTHNQDHYPFTIVDFVWNALLERKEEILAKDTENRKREDEERRRRR